MWGLGFQGFRVLGFGGFRVEGFRVLGFGSFRVEGLGSKECINFWATLRNLRLRELETSGVGFWGAYGLRELRELRAEGTQGLEKFGHRV